MSVLQVRVAEKRYVNAAVLRGIEFDIATRDVVCVVAPSGAGKTTLLNIIADLDSEYDGHVSLDSRMRHVGMVFQEPRLLPWLSVRENLSLVCNRETAALDEWLHITVLEHVAEKFPQQLSLGMQRRIALARAMIVRPQLLLMDEPFNSLDKPMADIVRAAVLEDVRSNGRTLLMTTHDLREAVALADRILFLSDTPACVLLDLDVNPVVRGDPDSARVRTFCQQLQLRYPRLLQGVVDDSSRNAEVRQ